jgi:cell division protein FtsZ
MKFDLPKEQSSIIKVIGVGGGGGNAVKHMYNQGIKGVDFIVCNTDAQALDSNPVPTKIQLGSSLTEGRGAGSIPEVGRNAAIENIDEVKALLEKNTHMVFITAGMGGGTGTGAAPVIAAAAREMNILTVGIVTIPFGFEGKKRKIQADEGIEAMRKAVDTLLIIKNDKLREIGGNLTLKDAFTHADEVLATAARGIAEVISVTGDINVDMNDVNTVMRNSGVAIMGSAAAEGEDRAMVAVQKALESPLLNDNDIQGARYVLLNITYGNREVLMDEISDITDYIQDAAGSTADVIWGHAMDESLEDKLCVTIIATGFKQKIGNDLEAVRPEKVVHKLPEDETQQPITEPVSFPTAQSSKTSVTSENPPQEEEPYIKQRDNAEEAQAEMSFDENETNDQEDTPFLKTEQTVQPTAETSEAKQKGPEEIRPEKKVYTLDDELPEDEAHQVKMNEIRQEPKNAEPLAREESMSQEERQRMNTQRMHRIKELTVRLKTPSGLSDLEGEPAYKRRNIRLDDTPHSSESEVSRYTLTDDGENEGRSELRSNNSFLHDNVD